MLLNVSFLYSDADQLSVKDLCHFKKIKRSNTDEMDSKMRDTGNDSASTAPRSTDESLSEDVFTESELSPIREELVSSDELRQDKSSGASSDSVQTVNQTGADHVTLASDSANRIGDVNSSVDPPADDDCKSVGLEAGEGVLKTIQGIVGGNTANTQTQHTQHGTNLKDGTDQESVKKHLPKGEECWHSEGKDSKREMTNKGEPIRDSETDVEELRKLWKSHTMQQTRQQRDNLHQDAHKEMKHKVAPADGTIEGKEDVIHPYILKFASVLVLTSLFTIVGTLCWSLSMVFPLNSNLESCNADMKYSGTNIKYI